LVLTSGWVYARQLCFLTQSVEAIENKGVEFLLNAKKCSRVRKQQEVKEIDEAKDVWKAAEPTGRLGDSLSGRAGTSDRASCSG
jgi:hypothetical protein